MLRSSYDVVIIGAGPAGLATALSVAGQSDATVLVADAGQPDTTRPGESLPPSALICLQQLGLKAQFSNAHFPYPGHVSLWGRQTPGYNDALLDAMGLPLRLDRPHFDRMLQAAARAQNVELAYHMRYAAQSANDDGYTLAFHARSGEQHTIHARFVVDATGPSARFARSLGIARHVDDRLVAIACTQQVTAGEMTLQTLTESGAAGWWYAASVPNGQLITMYITEAATSKQLLATGDRAFFEALHATKLIGTHLRSLTLVPGATQRFPVYSSLLQAAQGERWLAAGDAAACYDPIAAQGIYKALAHGVKAGRIIAGLVKDDFSDPVPADYSERIRQEYETYSANRNYLYDMEQRWPASAFWSNRQASAALRLVHSE